LLAATTHELMEQTTKTWQTFMRGKEKWLGNCIRDGYLPINYRRITSLGLDLKKYAITGVQQTRSQQLAIIKKMKITDEKLDWEKEQ